ncbi:MAG TPA: RsmD family RNA methyltransferase [Sphaerochaeta sp.]|nr:RsmD family RNA methyltransferase [Sphaerochaeta sp.]
MQVRVERLISGGRALAHDSAGKRVLVAGALPTEVVEARVEKHHASYTLATTERILSPHPKRIDPPCPHWGVCGGCDFQYTEHSYQAALKEAIVIEALQRIGEVDPGSYRLEAQALSPKAWEYRSRVRFFVSLGSKEAGFLKRGSNTLVPISHCPVLISSLDTLLADTTALYSAARTQLFANRVTGGLAEIPAFGTEEGAVLLDQTIIARVGEHPFSINAQVFFQSNLLLLEELGTYVAAQVLGKRVMDLYSGVGTFAAFVARNGRAVTAVERDRRCLHFAKTNAPTARFYSDAAEEWAKKQNEGVDTVIVDPPRVGLAAPLVPLIASWEPERIIYVNCDAVTLSRDVQRFGKLGYRVASLKLFDLYPQTFHTESVVVLERGTS